MTKKKQSNIIRNILADPYDNFWPQLGTNDEEVLNEHMERFLPLAKRHKGFISPKNLRAIHREKSKERRKELWKSLKVTPGIPQEEIDKAEENRKAMVLGVNSVTRAIEQEKIACCVVSGDIGAKPLVQHVVLSAARHKLPVVVVNTLQQKTNQYLGHSCLVLALKKEVSVNEEHLFHPLFQVIKVTAQKFTVPEEMKASCNDEDNYSDGNESHLNTSIKTKNNVSEDSEKKRCFAYLPRNSNSKVRSFVPNNSIRVRPSLGLGDYAPLSLNSDKTVVKSSSMNFSNDSSEEIEEDDDDDDEEDDVQLPKEGELFFFDKEIKQSAKSGKLKRKSSSKLKPLTVKRMKGNPKKRKKNKINVFQVK